MNDPLSENSNYIDPASVSVRPTAMRYGLIWGLVGIVLGLLTHMMGWNNPAEPNIAMSMVLWVAAIAIGFAMVYLAVKQVRDQELGGNITFGKAFTVGIVTALISGLIAMVWIFVYTNFIAPDLFVGMEDAMVEQWEEAGMSDEEIENAKGMAGMFTGPLMMTVSTIFSRLFLGAIAGLIIAAVMKKDPPHMA